MASISMNIEMMRVDEVFKSGRTLCWKLLAQFEWPWEALPEIGSFILQVSAGLDTKEYSKCENNVWIHKTAKVAPSAHIGKSVIIGEGAEVRHCAYVRENALIGCGSVVGNSTELKNTILFDEVQVPHFNYVGDSILGYKSHLGAGAITSNVKSDKTLVSVACGDNRIDTGLKKFGAILGDCVEVGCNSVLNPGSVIGAGASVYPLSFVRGFVPANSIYKRQGEVVRRN
ncbi:MAG: UDP-N-acetylglucosamine pyrophosphorylase [Oscillospiraceae bacterium]|nr:UDP-N-acetylglucosamine pyrophosphorylase [Oscillospiraceae bacterium]